MSDAKKLDESRLIRGPEGVFIYVPRKPPRTPKDLELDWPIGDPPEVHLDGKVIRYVAVVNDPPVDGDDLSFLTSSQIEWLRSREPEVWNLQRKR